MRDIWTRRGVFTQTRGRERSPYFGGSFTAPNGRVVPCVLQSKSASDFFTGSRRLPAPFVIIPRPFFPSSTCADVRFCSFHQSGCDVFENVIETPGSAQRRPSTSNIIGVLK